MSIKELEEKVEILDNNITFLKELIEDIYGKSVNEIRREAQEKLNKKNRAKPINE